MGHFLRVLGRDMNTICLSSYKNSIVMNKIIPMGIILMIIGFSIPMITESVLLEKMMDPNSSWSLHDQFDVTIEEWDERAIQEYWWVGLFYIIGYGILGIGIIVTVIGIIKIMKKKN